MYQPAVALPGSIPAWAGKPAMACPCRYGSPVYPRVGGETTLVDGVPAASYRVYPRVGGETMRASALACVRPVRSIPAWAGKPYICGDQAGRQTVQRVYPRVGGETGKRR